MSKSAQEKCNVACVFCGGPLLLWQARTTRRCYSKICERKAENSLHAAQSRALHSKNFWAGALHVAMDDGAPHEFMVFLCQAVAEASVDDKLKEKEAA